MSVFEWLDRDWQIAIAHKSALKKPALESQKSPIEANHFVAKAAAAAVAEDKTKGKKRVKRDKDAPKKPMSPFFCYQAVRRGQLKLEQPTLNNTGIIKVSKKAARLQSRIA